MSLLTPVRYPVKYYSWQDDQAPQLQDADGVIKTILKACLVTGYGDKAGAGWAARFEDDSRIVLRRPLQIGNPPDIKIENGVVSNKASHRIITQNNPSSLDDPAQLANIEIPTRDRFTNGEWHLIACDFAFLLCYNNGASGSTSYRYDTKNNVLFVGSLMSFTDENLFVMNKIRSVNGNLDWSYGCGIRYSDGYDQRGFFDLQTNKKINRLYCHTLPELEANSDLAQRMFISDSTLPFYVSFTSKHPGNVATQQILLSGRPMLKYWNQVHKSDGQGFLYIPLDYWEL